MNTVENSEQISTNFDSHLQEYILAVGTVKRDLNGRQSKSIQSEIVHKSLLDDSIKVMNGINYLSILSDHHIQHKILLHDGLSQTQQWGAIHYFYVKVIGSQNTAYGAAALLGKIFKQDAIGIYHPLTKDDRQMMNLKEDEMLSNNFHQYFTVYSDSVLSSDTILKIIKNICERFPELSGQLDPSGHLIEFHDFDSLFKGTSAQIEEILKENFQKIFQVKKQFSKSTVLTKYDYQQALNALDLSQN